MDGPQHKPEIYKVKGNVTELGKVAKEKALSNPEEQYDNHVGIAHTRWSTHGKLDLFSLAIATLTHFKVSQPPVTATPTLPMLITSSS